MDSESNQFETGDLDQMITAAHEEAKQEEEENQ